MPQEKLKERLLRLIRDDKNTGARSELAAKSPLESLMPIGELTINSIAETQPPVKVGILDKIKRRIPSYVSIKIGNCAER